MTLQKLLGLSYGPIRQHTRKAVPLLATAIIKIMIISINSSSGKNNRGKIMYNYEKHKLLRLYNPKNPVYDRPLPPLHLTTAFCHSS